ncbi:hypothetical protein PybrP1_002912 [[Pythium] brassicae (nom. inval.)]|nr:hypothetical protein PybrP1_002912 [[Pythium] brassicae (nom. inval.)]
MSAATTKIPDTFRAYVFERYGDALQNIKLVSLPQAPLSPTHVRIKTHAFGVNPIDYKLVEVGHRFLPAEPTPEKPFRLGFDVAGTVVETGAEVSRLKVGDAVYAMTSFDATGTFAEYVALAAEFVAAKPAALDFTHAAGLPVAGETSYQGLVTHGKLAPGHRVLVLGGSSATGALAIQIAKALGAAHIAATTSTRNVALVRSFGADEVIDYTQEKWGEVLAAHSVDLVYDCGVEPQAWRGGDAQKVLKRATGVFVTTAPHLGREVAAGGSAFVSFLTEPSATVLDTLSALVDAGKLVVPIDSVHAFEHLHDALKVQKSHRARGKIIVQVVDNAEESASE